MPPDRAERVFLLGKLVGAAGFEPTTTSPPDWCATRLRHAPTRGQSSTGRIAFSAPAP